MVFVFWLAASPVQAFKHICGAGTLTSGKIGAEQSGKLFKLDGQQQAYGLRGVYLPEDVVLKGSIELYAAGQEPDRYNRIMVQAFNNPLRGEWVQGRLLLEGGALVYGFGESPGCLKAMRNIERQAEAVNSGIWGQEKLPWPADNLELLAQKLGHFAIIEGKVLSVGNRKKRLYLNFGKKWSQDFTVSLVKMGKGAFKGDVTRLIGLLGKTVRVRGLLEERQGPLIRLNDEVQIEIIE